MSMTREEVTKRLKALKARCERLIVSSSAGNPEEWRKDAEAVEIAISALRPVSRERVEKVWSPCNFCAGAKYITGGVTAVYPVSETHQQETLAEGDFDFCPVCGRPITDEAVQMVMERLEALYEQENT